MVYVCICVYILLELVHMSFSLKARPKSAASQCQQKMHLLTWLTKMDLCMSMTFKSMPCGELNFSLPRVRRDFFIHTLSFTLLFCLVQLNCTCQKGAFLRTFKNRFRGAREIVTIGRAIFLYKTNSYSIPNTPYAS